MAWSTREIAGLAGTTVNTIRHYHRLGLLDEPEREDNGYKQYEVSHLVSLLRIRRLVALGVSLAEIPAVRASEGRSPDTLRAVDSELEANIERLTQARREIAAILHNGAPADAPAGFESVAANLSEADSSMIHLYARLYDASALADIQEMTEGDAITLAADIEALPADADEGARLILIDRLAATLTQNFVDYPWLRDPASHLPRGGRDAAETLARAVVELYNPAQLDVFVRASILAQERVRAAREDGTCP